MAEVVYGEQALAGPHADLVRLFETEDTDGTLYVGYPILTNVEGTVKVDALYVSQSSGVVVFDLSNLGARESDASAVQEVQRVQDRYYAAIHSKLLETPELLSRRNLVVPISIISVTMETNAEAGDALLCTIDRVIDNISFNDRI